MPQLMDLDELLLLLAVVKASRTVDTNVVFTLLVLILGCGTNMTIGASVPLLRNLAHSAEVSLAIALQRNLLAKKTEGNL